MAYDEITYTIKPHEVLDQRGVKYRQRGQYLDVYECPFCEGGRSSQKHTFAVHREKGYYFCLRTSCGSKGNFWKLLQYYGFNPPNYIERSGNRRSTQKKKFIYGRR